MVLYAPAQGVGESYFNGAMAVRPWMEGQPAEVRAALALQWGHGREAMDGYKNTLKWMDAHPLQWGHGREAMDGGAPARRRRAAPPTSMGPWP